MTEVLVRVKSRLFTGWITLLDDVCITTSPLLSWCKGKDASELRNLFKLLDWKTTIVTDLPLEASVMLTRDALLKASPEEKAELEALFGADMIRSIVGGNAEEFEGVWRVNAARREKK